MPVFILVSQQPPDSAGFLLSFLFSPECGGNMFHRNFRLSELHDITTQMTVLVLITMFSQRPPYLRCVL